ncbi:MAG: hypothetical protein ACFFE6_14475 [Candidatus Thorarchaeota archaeon]
MTTSTSLLDSQAGRFFLMILAAIGLNLGFFIILALFTPLVVGLVVGYLFQEAKIVSSFIGFMGALISYTGILLVTEYLTGFTTDYLTIVTAVILMALMGALGGFLGAMMRSRSK